MPSIYSGQVSVSVAVTISTSPVTDGGGDQLVLSSKDLSVEL